MGSEKILSPWNIQISWSEWSFIRPVFCSIIHSNLLSDTMNQVYLWTSLIAYKSQAMSDRKTTKSFDYVIMIIDLADEILEFTNLVVVTLFFPFLPPWDIYDDLLYLWNKKKLLLVGFEPKIFWLQPYNNLFNSLVPTPNEKFCTLKKFS